MFPMLVVLLWISPLYGENSENEQTLLPYITYHIWTKNDYDYENVTLDGDLPNISTENPVRIFFHGFRDHGLTDSQEQLFWAYYSTDIFTFISVDWSEYSGTSVADYANAVILIPDVAYSVTQFIKKLIAVGVAMESIHLIGFSLGAHLAGFVGANFKGKLTKIVGLDPAAVGFSVGEPRLSESHAKLVLVYHTTGGVLSTSEPFGHIDVYPNSGNAPQPCCEHESMFNPSCSHYFAVHVLSESIRYPEKYVARSCSSWSKYLAGNCEDGDFFYLGGEIKESQNGLYYVDTFIGHTVYMCPKYSHIRAKHRLTTERQTTEHEATEHEGTVSKATDRPTTETSVKSEQNTNVASFFPLLMCFAVVVVGYLN